MSTKIISMNDKIKTLAAQVNASLEENYCSLREAATDGVARLIRYATEQVGEINDMISRGVSPDVTLTEFVALYHELRTIEELAEYNNVFPSEVKRYAQLKRGSILRTISELFGTLYSAHLLNHERFVCEDYGVKGRGKRNLWTEAGNPSPFESGLKDDGKEVIR